MIRKAKISEINEILTITKACARYMNTQGIFQWNENYPSYEAFLKDAQREELYVLEIEQIIVGAVVISTYMDDVYYPIQWLTKSGNNIYIHRLCVHPECQGKGYAQQLMTFAEDYARTHSFLSIRLDTFSQNQRNQRFYEARGYQKLGDVFFPKKSEYPFHCYELVL